ncbi:putative tail tape measure protein [Bajunvirus bajun]|uniref:Lysozyme n=1 Tax=Brevundimonas phage vB_BgoS-Bajun TaxID=2948594 RepID=A0A9E7SRQ7_9CAUD|nr:putative tail tape measure protein [Brevundimonas phage vB_BgoS-Bajun]
MTEQTSFKIDSKGAQRDLDALASALDRAAGAAGRMDRDFAKAAQSADKNLKTASRAMERYAQIATLLSRIKFAGDGAGQIAKFGQALDSLGKARSIKPETIKGFVNLIDVAARAQRIAFNPAFGNSIRDIASAMDSLGRARPLRDGTLKSFVQLIDVTSRAQRVRIDPGFAAGMKNIAGAMDFVGRARAIRPQTLKSFVDFIEIAARSQRLKFDPSTAQSLRAFGAAISQLKPPGKAAIERLDKMFVVLANAKKIPNAAAIARDLDMVAAAAGRASNALGALPARMRSAGGGGGGRAFQETAAGANAATKGFSNYASGAEKAGKGTYTLGERLRGLNHRFSIAYQAGTLFTSMFASFTLGGFIKGIFDASINLAKLEKSMTFATRSTEAGHQATMRFIGAAQEMGLSLNSVSESFGRFSISSGAAGMSQAESSEVFMSVARSLQVVGASAQQTEYAMYGLTQMIQKGKVSSEEFNRQIGEQIPGNATAGAMAMSKILGRKVELAEFFDMMRKGQIMSKEFSIEWARALNSMFAPMQGMLQNRPDLAVNRLKNAFTIFQQEIGKNRFMTEIGVQLNRLAGLFGKVENGVFKLHDPVRELAKQLGHNLANGVRVIGDALVWAFENMDKLILAGKGMAALLVGSTFFSWGKSAIEAAGKIMLMVGAMRAAKVEAAATATAKTVQAAATTPGIVGAGASTADIIAQRNMRGIAPTAVGGSVTTAQKFASNNEYGVNTFARPTGPDGKPAQGMGARQFGRRALSPALANAGAASAAASGAGQIASAGTAAAGAAPKVNMLSGAIRGLGLAFGAFSLLAIAAVATLAVFSDKQVEVAGKSVKGGDIMMGSLDVVGKSFKDWAKTTGDSITGVSGSFDWLDKNAGELMVGLMAAVITIGKTFLTVFTSIGKIIGTVVANMIIPAMMGISKLAKGDIIGAAETFLKESFTGNASRMMETAREIGGDFVAAADYEGTATSIRTAAIGRATDRNAANNANDLDQQRQTDAALRQQDIDAANMQREAAARQIDAARRMQEAMSPPSWQALRTRIVALATGEYAASNPVRAPGSAATATVSPTGATAGNTPAGATAARPTGGNSVEMARSTIARFEGFRNTAYWDVNALRAGYGSDTTTDAATGRVSRITRGSNVSRADADADLSRRITTEFMPVAQRAVGAAWANLDAATQAALTSVTYNYGNLPGRVARVVRAGGTTAEIADAVQGLGSDNNGVNRRRRAAEAGMIRSGTGIAAGGGSGNPGSDDDVQKQYEQAMNDYKSLQSFSAQSGPMGAALASIASKLEPLRDIIERDESRVAGGAQSLFTPEMVAQMDSAMAGLIKELADAVNPFAALVRKMNQSNDVTAMTLAGGNESSVAWRQALNDLKDQGYDLEAMEDPTVLQSALNDLLGEEHSLRVQNLADAQVEFELARLRGKNLQAEVDLLQTRNALTVQNIVDTGSRREGIFANLVNASSDVGSYEDKLMGLTAQQRASMGANAALQDSAAATAAARDIRVQLSEMLSNEHLTQAQRSFRETYKQALEQLTGLSGRTLGQLTSQATDSQRALADQYAKTIERLENPPGFQAWVDGLEPFARRMEKIKTDFMDNLSDGITDSLMGEEVDWKGMLKSMTRDYLKAQVDEQLKGIMGWFGIGKGAEEAATPEAQALVDAGTNLSQVATAQITPAATELSTAGTGLQTAATALNGAAQAISVAASSQGSIANTAISAISSAATGSMDTPLDLNSLMDGTPESAARQNAITKSLNSSSAGVTPANDNILSDMLQDIGTTSSKNPMTEDQITRTLLAFQNAPSTEQFDFGAMLSKIMGGTVSAEDNNALLAGDVSSLAGTILNPGGGGGPLQALMGMFGMGGGGGGPMQALMGMFGMGGGGGGGGPMQAIMGMFGGGGGGAGGPGQMLSSLFGGGSAGKGGGPMQMLMTLASPILGQFLNKKKEPKTVRELNVGGLLNPMGGVTTEFTEVAAHANPIAQIANMALSAFTGGFGKGGGMSFGKTMGNMGSSMSGNFGKIGKLFGGFQEGGIAGSPVTFHSAANVDWSTAPHYAEGTANTSGGMPAILHPEEAVIPLSRGRKIGVEMKGGSTGGMTNVNSNITIVAQDPNAFRASKASIARNQARTLKRAAVRNLNPL